MGHYFIVLQLPGSEELRFTGHKSPRNFWTDATAHILGGKARVLCQRTDTGISEELRGHVKALKEFTTYLLLGMKLDKQELESEELILNKAAGKLNDTHREVVVDAGDKFQLVAIDA